VAGELERVQGEIQRLRNNTGRLVPPAGNMLPARVRAVDEEVMARGAVIAGMGRLSRLAGQVDSLLAKELHRSVLETTAEMEAVEAGASSPRAQALAKDVTDIFSRRHFAHQAAYYDVFGEQVMEQLSREVSAPPPPRRRFRLFGDE
jgi:hypothetical protein